MKRDMQNVEARLAALPPDPMEEGYTDADYAAIGDAAAKERGRRLTVAEMHAFLDEIEAAER